MFKVSDSNDACTLTTSFASAEMPYSVGAALDQQDVTVGGDCTPGDLEYSVTISPTPPGTSMFTKHESDPYGAEWSTSDTTNVGVYTVSVTVYSTS